MSITNNDLSSEESRILNEIKKQVEKIDYVFTEAEFENKKILDSIDKQTKKELDINERDKNKRLLKIETQYFKEFESIKANIEVKLKQQSITELSWENPLWNEYDNSKIQNVPNLLRLGEITYNGKYGSISVPAMLPLVGSNKNLLIESDGSRLEEARNTVQALVLRTLASFPAGKARLISIDPVGLGATVAGFIMDLPDSITQGKAWTESSHIEQQLANLEMEMARIKQKLLGKKYSCIEDYNNDAGVIEEPYRFLVIADFPDRFSDSAAQRLISIIINGPTTGVYSIILVNTDREYPHNFEIKDIERHSHILHLNSKATRWDEEILRECDLVLDTIPNNLLFISILKEISDELGKKQNIEIPFSEIIPKKCNWWQGNASEKLQFPIGISGASSILNMTIDENQSHNALIIGKVGLGKSNLLQVIIDSLSLNYSPKEIELCLLDLKQVTFEVYARYKLPHASIISVNTETEFALSVLHRLENKIKSRENLFRDNGVQDLSGYRNETGKLIPRIILIIDEFQELFVDDFVGREADRILERLVRLGRALGIHVILSSQTMRGKNSISSVTKDLIPIRIALQCSDVDARSVMSDDNNEAFFLERPGQAIYNTKNGRIEGNTKFQVYWMEEKDRRQLLLEMYDYAKEYGEINENQIIYDGRSLSKITDNKDFLNMLDGTRRNQQFDSAIAYYGEPIEIKEHCSFAFRRMAGRNLLIVGNVENELHVTSILVSMIISLLTQFSPQDLQITIVLFAESETTITEICNVRDTFSSIINIVEGQKDSENLLLQLNEQINSYIDDEKVNRHTLKTHFLIIFGLQSIKKLRTLDIFSSKATGEQDFSVGMAFRNVIDKGPEYGVHTISWCDSIRNVERGIGSEGFESFNYRIAFQMSEADSRRFIESDNANNLDIYRALSFDIDKGKLEKFRPYNIPEKEILKRISQMNQNNQGKKVKGSK